MDSRPAFGADALDLALHDLDSCATLCRSTLLEHGALPDDVRGELAICIAGCELASAAIRARSADLGELLEFCEDACGRCVDSLAGLGDSAEVAPCARMADLCRDSLLAILYDAPFG